MAWQVASETCAYLKFDAWGHLSARFEAHTVVDGPAWTQAYAGERSRRLPVRPLEALRTQHEGLSIEALAPPRADDATAWGLVVDGVCQ